jgi:hypothetical protein
MAMGSRGRREAENAIGSCRPFKNSTGSFYGTRGSTRTLGWLESHTDAARIRELLSQAVYVVWSYGTPISWVTETEDGDRTAYYVDEHHSMTTSHHQSTARVGLGEYETIGQRRPARRPRRAQWTPAHVQAALPDLDFSNRRGYISETARERAMETGAVRAEHDRSLVGSPGYQNGLTENQQEATLARLLDPRYSNPDWVPGRDAAQRDADYLAERRDRERVDREGAWRP